MSKLIIIIKEALTKPVTGQREGVVLETGRSTGGRATWQELRLSVELSVASWQIR